MSAAFEEAKRILASHNGMMKDFYDIHKMAASLQLDGRILLKAIETTFDSRYTDIPIQTPTGLTDESGSRHQSQWKVFLEKMAGDSDGTSAFQQVLQEL